MSWTHKNLELDFPRERRLVGDLEMIRDGFETNGLNPRKRERAVEASVLLGSERFFSHLMSFLE